MCQRESAKKVNDSSRIWYMMYIDVHDSAISISKLYSKIGVHIIGQVWWVPSKSFWISLDCCATSRKSMATSGILMARWVMDSVGGLKGIMILVMLGSLCTSIIYTFFSCAFWISLSLVVYRWEALHHWKLCVSNAFAAFPVSMRFPASDHGFFEQAKSNKPGVLLSKLGLVIPTVRCYSRGNSYVVV